VAGGIEKNKTKMVKLVTRRHVSERGLIPAVSNGGNEENKNRKWVILKNKCDRYQI